MEDEFTIKIFLFIGFMAVAVFSSVFLRKIRFPFTIGLVVIGFFFGFLAIKFNYLPISELNLTPEIILYLILPTLIYDAAINIDIKALFKNIIPILLLAIFGVLISTGIIGGVLSSFTTMTIGMALLFGALISATDPVAVIALFSEIGAPKRLVTLVDGESIFNDATAIVMFTIVLSSITNKVSSQGSTFFNSFLDFLIVLLGGILIGVLIGILGGLIVRIHRSNNILQVTISLIMAYISFITADKLHVSGVMSTLAAGIVVSLLSNDVIKHENHYYQENFWHYFSFVANSFVFLLLGITEANSFENPEVFFKSLKILLIVIPTVTLARAIIVFVLIPLYNLIDKKNRISFPYQTVLFWGGLRGAVPVALVLAIPADLPGKDLIVHLTLGYIMFTLLVQGTTVKAMMKKLNIQADKSYFDYHKGVSYSLTYPSIQLLDLVTTQILSTFKDEGFYVTENKDSYQLSRGQKYLVIDTTGSDMKITAADNQDLAYGKQTIYETLLELDNSVSTLQHLVKSPLISDIVKEDESNTDYKSKFNISKFLNKDLINITIQGNDKLSIITELIDIAVEKGYIKDRQLVLDAVLEREKSMTTGIGGGIAIPHAKCNDSENIVLVVGIKKEGVDFDSLDSKPTKLFFLIISPKQLIGPHIQLLAEIGRKCNNSELKEKLINSLSAEEFISISKTPLK